MIDQFAGDSLNQLGNILVFTWMCSTADSDWFVTHLKRLLLLHQ